jgi:very-short-patch-repair endonuclease
MDAKTYIHYTLFTYCQRMGFKLEQEYRFHDSRKWRADWAIPAKMLIIEFEGGLYARGKGGHTSITGIERDIEKYNEATVIGWSVIRLTAKNYKSLPKIMERL